jgi:hypothetical protein
VASFFLWFCKGQVFLLPLKLMRVKLGKDEGIRKKFTATFSRIGKKKNFKGYSEDTILLMNVTDAETSAVVADHIWFSYTKSFEKVILKDGILIEFEARVKSYAKGYVNKAVGINHRKTDFKLSHPTKIKIISNFRFQIAVNHENPIILKPET